MGVEEPRLIRLDSDEPEEHVLPEGETRIGRSRANAICLRASTVSRFHCYLVRQGDDVRVFDGDSKNPARLNGEPVSGQRLRTGQVLVVGKAEFVYQGRVIDEAPVPAAAGPPRTTPEPGATRPAFPAHRSPAGAVRRRRRERVRSREPALIAALVLLLAVPAVVWLVVAGSRSTEDRSATRIPAPDPSTADLASRLQAQIADIEKIREQELARTNALSAKKIEELSAQLLELHAELERVRAQPANPTDTGPRKVFETPPSERPREPPDKLHAKFSIPEEQPPDEPTTVVIPRTPPLVRRRLEEVRDIQKRLERNLEDYATHVIAPAVLAPDLEKLWLTEGRDAAAALLELEKNARGFLRETDESIELNRKRKEALLAKARSGSGTPPSSDPKAYPKYAPAPSGRETDQRWLDAFDKAAEIHRSHRQYLAPLRTVILEAIARISAPEGLDALRTRLATDDDEDLCLAIAGSFEASRWQESIPALARRLPSARSDRLRGGLRKALTGLVGEDLGDRSAPWLEWWSARQ